MKKILVNIPKEINYLSEYEETLMSQLPQNCHYILDKIVTGCGATEMFINSKDNIILASPRKILLQNKKDQHPFDVYLVVNEIEKISYDRDLEDKKEIKEILEELKNEKDLESLTYIMNLKNEINQYFNDCRLSFKPNKILVTYDSLKHVIDALGETSKNFKVIVDEFQSIFTDSSFKSTVELNFVEFLQDIPSVCYLSATPMLEKYLDKIPEFCNLPYYQLNLDISRIIKPLIYRKKSSSISSSCANFIDDYLNNKFPQKLVDGKIVESKEVVFYVNSIKEISNIISVVNSRHKNENNPDNFVLNNTNTNIICSINSRNKKKIKNIVKSKDKSKVFTIGTVPTKNQFHKMFTFCTRTVYLGADFYSTNAYTVICSNSNINCLALDISLDLPQIMGRQRLPENVFRFEALFFYKTTEKEITQDDFEKRVKEKDSYTKKLLENFQAAPNKSIAVNERRKLVIVDRYKDNYAAVSEKTGEVVYNNLVALSELRAFEVQQKNYKDDVSLYNAMSNVCEVQKFQSELEISIKKFFKDFLTPGKYFVDKIKLYCEFADKYGNKELKHTNKIPRDYHFYYELLGTSRIKALKYQEADIKNEINNLKKNDDIFKCFTTSFLLGKKYTKKYIKETTQLIYDNLGIKKKAKATDIQNYFEIKRVRITIDGKENEGFEILKIK